MAAPPTTAFTACDSMSLLLCPMPPWPASNSMCISHLPPPNPPAPSGPPLLSVADALDHTIGHSCTNPWILALGLGSLRPFVPWPKSPKSVGCLHSSEFGRRIARSEPPAGSLVQAEAGVQRLQVVSPATGDASCRRFSSGKELLPFSICSTTYVQAGPATHMPALESINFTVCFVFSRLVLTHCS
jgi:hypothetical protein